MSEAEGRGGVWTAEAPGRQGTSDEGRQRLEAPRSRANQKPQDPLRGILGKFATGVTILAAGRDKPQGMTANSFTSVSLSPPLVLVCVNRSAAIHRAVTESKSFAISVLAAHQEDVARHFADHSRPRGKREFDIVGWSPGPVTGAPLIHGTLAWLECELAATYDGGTHSIFLGSVLASTHGPGRDALLFYGGAFHRPTLQKT